MTRRLGCFIHRLGGRMLREMDDEAVCSFDDDDDGDGDGARRGDLKC